MKKLLILSGKGGTGKTTVAAAFMRLSKASAVADCDVDAPNLGLVSDFQGERRTKDFIGAQKAFIDSNICVACGLCASKCRFSAIEKENGTYHIRDIACEGCALCTAVCPVNAISMLDDVAGKQCLLRERQKNNGSRIFSGAKLKMGRGNSGKLVTEVKSALFKAVAVKESDLVRHFDPSRDLAIIDGSPGIGCPVIASVAGVDLLLIVAEPSISGFSDLSRLLETGNQLQTKAVVCVNKWDISRENTQKIKNYCRQKEVPFVGCIPFDRKVIEAVNQGISPVDCESSSGEALRKIYREVLSRLAG